MLSQHHVLTNELRGLCKKYSDHWFKPVRAKKTSFQYFPYRINNWLVNALFYSDNNLMKDFNLKNCRGGKFQ